MVLHVGPYMVPIPPVGAIFAFGVPVVIGFAWVWRDANSRGQPGPLWALLTIPLNWVALLGYLVVRALQQPRTTVQQAPNESGGTTAP